MKRTDSIVAVLVAKYATMYIEADTPEDAYNYAKKHCHKVDDSEFKDSYVYVDSCETFTTESYEHMEKIWIEDGKTISFDDYIDELEK